MRKGFFYQQEVILSQDSLQELYWFIDNLKLHNGRPLILSHPDMFMTTDASLKGWGASCQGQRTEGSWSITEKDLHINVLEIIAVKYAILTFTKIKKPRLIHLKMDNIVALTYLLKMGGTRNIRLIQETKEIWNYLIGHGIMITVEYLPSHLNVIADQESRNCVDKSEWKLSPIIFDKICRSCGIPEIDLFASHLSNQVPAYMSWRPNPYIIAVDALQQPWHGHLLYAFPPFSLITRVLSKIRRERVLVILITPAWNSQPWYAMLLQMLIRKSFLLPSHVDLLKDPMHKPHTLLLNQSLRLVAWRISGNISFQREFQRGLQSLPLEVEEIALSQLTNRPGESGLAGVVNRKLIPFNAL